MFDKNLKGLYYKLLYYCYCFIGEEEMKMRVVNNEQQYYKKKELEKIYIFEEEIRCFFLDKYG